MLFDIFIMMNHKKIILSLLILILIPTNHFISILMNSSVIYWYFMGFQISSLIADLVFFTLLFCQILLILIIIRDEIKHSS